MLRPVPAEGIGVIPWSPLARGRLARPWASGPARSGPRPDEFGKTLYRRTEESDRAVVDRVGEIAAARGVPRRRSRWPGCSRKPVVTAPIIGATKPHHLEDAVAALSIELTAEEIAALEEPYMPHPVLGFS